MKFLKLLAIIILFTSAANAQTTSKPKIKIGVMVYPNVEVLDFCGPVEVFSDVDGFEVYTISTGPNRISTKNQALKLTPDYTIENAPIPDVLIIPGGYADPVSRDQNVITWIKKANQTTTYTMSVCNGAMILNATGLLVGKTVTTHTGSLDELARIAPKTKVIREKRWVQDGKIITTAGISAGIDGALHVVGLYKGNEVVKRVVEFMQYNSTTYNDGIVK